MARFVFGFTKTAIMLLVGEKKDEEGARCGDGCCYCRRRQWREKRERRSADGRVGAAGSRGKEGVLVAKLRGEAVVRRWTVGATAGKEIEEKVEAKMEVSGRWFTCNYGGGDAGFLTKKVRGGQFW
ncbi:hypothetical protein HAX54_015373 [Datura stramonium]|uniref:Uncharacterized protein n=1 Tax=Datura stramonium TaxID=4076 RepID=A0ABS8S2W0_DATST|nr:hypothetical protein [Datura stramonium]